MKKIFLAYSWILLSTGVILIGSASILFFSIKKQNNTIPHIENNIVQAATQEIEKISLDGQVKGIETIIETQDARPIIVSRFLERYNSPLQPYDHFGQVFVDLADENGFDFRLLPAIAMQESNLCKKIPEGSYNCLGFGIHSKGTLTFDSFEANFERAAKELKANYIDQGRTTPEEIMKKYTPGSNGSWADSVTQWMAEMKYDDREKGKESEEEENVLEYVNKESLPN